MTSTLSLCLAAAWLSLGQALPAPRDGDIRVLYWELQTETTVWLTLEPRSADGKLGPPGHILTFTLRFPGKRPKAPPQHVDLEASVGRLWSPRVELWFVLDEGAKIDLLPPGLFALSTGTVSDYLSVKVSIVGLRHIAAARRVRGNALGVDFEFTESQRQAVRAFLDRVLSDNPAQLSK